MIFEIGLVLSGTVSAGPYTAGVLDYLVEALDTWYAARRDGQDVPMHDVQLKVVAATSGGAMTAALLPGMLYGDFKHYREAGDEERVSPDENRLYYSWVEEIDIDCLLEKKDLDRFPYVRSLFDSTQIESILDRILSVRSFGKPRLKPDWLDPQLDVYLMVTDLLGVPYGIDMHGVSLGMRAHGTFVHFVLNGDVQNLKRKSHWLSDAICLNPTKSQATDNASWTTLKVTALGSGAFPIALPVRELERHRRHYAELKWVIPTDSNNDCTVTKGIPPARSWTDSKENYRLVGIDGGVVNNSALEYARMALRGSFQARNPRFADLADKAVIMVSPLNRQQLRDNYPDRFDIHIL